MFTPDVVMSSTAPYIVGSAIPHEGTTAQQMTTAVTDRPAVVYLIAQPSISRKKTPVNITPLYAHGEVKLVLPQGDSPTFSAKKCLDLMDNRLFPEDGSQQYDPDVDYLVWAGGDTLAAVLCGMLLAEREIWTFQWLRYERARLPNGTRTDEGAVYVPITIDLSDPHLEENDTATDRSARRLA
jgi:hypothetical protein